MFIFSAMPESSAWQQICRWQMMEEEAAHKEEDAIQSGAPLSTFLFSREGTCVQHETEGFELS